MNKKIGLFVSVYKLRYDKLLRHLPHINKNIDCYIVAQTNDPSLAEYEYYCVNDKIKLLTFDVTNLAQKREAINQYAIENNYDYIIHSDDDFSDYAKQIVKGKMQKNGKFYKPIKITFSELIDYLIKQSEKIENLGTLTTALPNVLSFASPGDIGNKTPAGLYLIDVNNIKKYDIHYDDTDTFEDLDFSVKCLMNGLNVKQICDATFDMPDYLSSQSVVFTNFDNTSADYKRSIMTIKTAMKWRWSKMIVREKDIHLKIDQTFFKTYFKAKSLPHIDPQLMAAYKTLDLDKIRNYFLTHKNK